MENQVELLNNEQLTELIELVTQQNELISALYTNSLFCIGVVGAVLVLFLLYKFIRMFY